MTNCLLASGERERERERKRELRRYRFLGYTSGKGGFKAYSHSQKREDECVCEREIILLKEIGKLSATLL